MEKKEFYLVSHTHWDREWYMPFEQFRYRLVALVDYLLDVLSENPAYVFHFDAQTVVLEDYFEIKPERKEELCAAIRRGQIRIGPWYLQNDFYYSSGEATVRNLLLGKRICEEIGAGDTVGYAPDQFGSPRQIPQILRGFGIDGFVFGRGYRPAFADEEGNPVGDGGRRCEFIWQSPDGSSVNAFYLMLWYNNAQHFPEEGERAMEMLKNNGAAFAARSDTPFVLLMNGVDHLFPQPNVLQNIENVRPLAERAGITVRQRTLAEYVADSLQWIKDHKIERQVFSGDLAVGPDWDVLRGCRSSRIDLKKRNVYLSAQVKDLLEPLFAAADCKGMTGVYPASWFTHLWKQLLKNLTHDSICGCSADDTCRSVNAVYDRVEQVCEMLKDAAAQELLRRGAQKDFTAVAANTLGEEYRGALEFTIDLPASDQDAAIVLFNGKNRFEADVISQENIVKEFITELNLFREAAAKRVRFRIVDTLAPFSVKYYSVETRPCDRAQESAAPQTPAIENEFFVLKCENGEIELTEKNTGKTLNSFFFWRDFSESGDSYIHFDGKDEPLVFSRAERAERSGEGSLVQKLTLYYRLRLPACYDFANRKRAEEYIEVPASATFALSAGSDLLEIEYSVENSCKDHCLQAVFRVGEDTARTVADGTFDVRENNVNTDLYPQTESKTFFCASFVSAAGEGRTPSIFTAGEHEYEPLAGGEIAVTVLRCVGSISRDRDFSPRAERWTLRDGQMLGTHAGKLGYRYCETRNFAQNVAIARRRLVSPFTAAGARDSGVYTKARAGVQAGDMSRIYRVKDRYPSVILNERPALSLHAKRCRAEAFKRSEDGKGYILRAVNYTDEAERVRLEFDGKIYLASLDESARDYLGEGDCEYNAKRHEIMTFYLERN